MAGRALTPAGVILKWILIPAALLAIGFFLIGAKIGRFIPGFGGGSEPSEPIASSAAQRYASPSVDVESTRSMAPPEVDVTSRRTPHHRRHRKSTDSKQDSSTQIVSSGSTKTGA